MALEKSLSHSLMSPESSSSALASRPKASASRSDLRASPPRWSCLYRLSGVREEPEPRYRHELALWEDQLYVLGGGTSFSADRFEDLPTFSIVHRRWYYTRTKPDPLATIDNVSCHT